MLPGHRIPPSNLSHVPRQQGSTSNSVCCQATGFHIKPSHVPRTRVPVSGLSHVPSAQVPPSNLSHLPVHRFLIKPHQFPANRFQNQAQSCSRPQGSTIKPQSCSQATGFHNQTSHVPRPQFQIPLKSCSMPQVPESILSYVPRLQGSRIKPQSCSQSTGFQNQASVRFPGHSIPQSKQMSISQATGFQNHASVMFPGPRDPQSNLSHVHRPQGSTIKLTHIPRTKVSRIKTISCSQATRYQIPNDVMFPVHRVPPSNLSHVARPQVSVIKPHSFPSPQGSRIKPQSFCQATGLPTSNLSHVPATGSPSNPLMFPGHRVPQSNLSHVPRPQVPHQIPLMFPGHRVPESSLTHIPRPQGSTIKPQSYSQATVFHNQT